MCIQFVINVFNTHIYVFNAHMHLFYICIKTHMYLVNVFNTHTFSLSFHLIQQKKKKN